MEQHVETANPCPLRHESRRSWIAKTGVTFLSSCAIPANAALNEDAVPEASYQVERMGTMPLGLGNMAGKSKPEQGIKLEGGVFQGDDGKVIAKLVVSEGKQVSVSFFSPWKLVTGMAYDVEARDRKNGEGCYLQVSKVATGENLASLPSSFFLDAVLSSSGRYGAYGTPTGIKVLKSQFSSESGYRTLELAFSALSPSYTEVPRRLLISASQPGGQSSDVVMLVGGSSAARWKKGADQMVQDAVGSFRAIPYTPTKFRSFD